MKRTTLFVLAALALVGCSDHPVDQLLAVNDSTTDEICDCPAFSTEDFCIMPDTFTAAERSCLKRVYDDNESALSAEFD